MDLRVDHVLAHIAKSVLRFMKPLDQIGPLISRECVKFRCAFLLLHTHTPTAFAEIVSDDLPRAFHVSKSRTAVSDD
jgi:hypothetical protein